MTEYPESFMHLLKSNNIDIEKFDKFFFFKVIDLRCENLSLEKNQYFDYIIKYNNEIFYFKDTLYNHYSLFFRNPLTFSLLEHYIFNEIIGRKKNGNITEFRIWTCACAKGQEAYSIAIIIDEIVNKLNSGVTFRIFASDIDERNIFEANQAIYKDADIGNITFNRLNKYFIKNQDTYTIIPKLKENLIFSTFDLTNESLNCPELSIYGNFDLIFCSNLLFYYNDFYKEKILKKLKGCLSFNGYLITDDSETEIVRKANTFQSYYFISNIFKNKTEK